MRWVRHFRLRGPSGRTRWSFNALGERELRRIATEYGRTGVEVSHTGTSRVPGSAVSAVHPGDIG